MPVVNRGISILAKGGFQFFFDEKARGREGEARKKLSGGTSSFRIGRDRTPLRGGEEASNWEGRGSCVFFYVLINTRTF